MESAATVKGSTYAKAAKDLKRRLADVISREDLRELQRKRPWRHFLVVVRQVLLLSLTGWTLWLDEPGWIRWLWVPATLVMGFTVFNFTVLLHEVVHRAVFSQQRPRLNRLLGHLYAFPSGIAASQFTRWHLDHHRHLGSGHLDPKRHHLSPKRNARWLKLLYFTPALFPIYFRGAARETATYAVELRRRIGWERRLTILGHLGILAALALLGSPWIAVRVYVVPVFLVFPVAFVINRLGQHYDIDPENPAGWSTLVRSSAFWDFAYLWSNMHLEHHYFAGVPFYNLPKLQRKLRPFYEKEGLRMRGYGGLLWDWLVRNRAPHTRWAS